MKIEVTHQTCREHRWPRSLPGKTIRSIGSVTHQQCNNCLAMKLEFDTDVLTDKGWVRLTYEKVVEPHFKLPSK